MPIASSVSLVQADAVGRAVMALLGSLRCPAVDGCYGTYLELRGKFAARSDVSREPLVSI
jgi:hypothetical protein